MPSCDRLRALWSGGRVGEGPWAHVDMLGTAFLDEDRGDAFGRGATGYGVRMLVELAARLADPPA